MCVYSTYDCVLKLVTSRKKNETKSEHQSIAFAMDKKQVYRGERGGNKVLNGRNRHLKNTTNDCNKNALALNGRKHTKKKVQNIHDVGKGPFIQYGSRFASIPQGMTVDDLSEEKCRELIGANIKMSKPKGKRKYTKKKSSYK